ncbi:unnamed protein product [Brugia pahangi]|uniref:EGF-like domain-containing protein n=1 Tax=Brugia pahangi TaxID=6280 RepID=A0A0N4T9C0_BRUPA|nr:unnamed protein product [Brugia pahangi]
MLLINFSLNNFQISCSCNEKLGHYDWGGRVCEGMSGRPCGTADMTLVSEKISSSVKVLIDILYVCYSAAMDLCKSEQGRSKYDDRSKYVKSYKQHHYKAAEISLYIETLM